MAGSGPHISIAAEKLVTIGGLTITNSIFTSLIVSTLLISFAIIVHLKLKNTNRPTGLQNFAEMIIESLHAFIHGITGDLKKTRLFFPIISTFFLFILLNNWIGLLPGVGTIRLLIDEPVKAESHSSLITTVNASEQVVVTDTHIQVENTDATVAEEKAETHVAEKATHGPVAVPILRPGSADLNTTLALALLSVFLTQVFGFYHLKFGYFKKFINFSSPIMFFVGILELISEFAKIISFAFRLFGNIFAGEVLLVVISFLIPIIVPMPFYGLELFVGFIQALVFSMLSLVFFNMATHSHDEH